MADNKWVTLVARLNQLTQEGRLKWVTEPSPTDTSTTMFDTASYVCKYQDKGFRISSTTISSAFSSSGIIKLYVVDSKGSVLWEVPMVPGIKDLYETIRFKSAGIDDLIDSIVGKKP